MSMKWLNNYYADYGEQCRWVVDRYCICLYIINIVVVVVEERQWSDCRHHWTLTKYSTKSVGCYRRRGAHEHPQFNTLAFKSQHNNDKSLEHSIGICSLFTLADLFRFRCHIEDKRMTFFSVSHWLLFAFLGISVDSIVIWIRVGRTNVRTPRNNNMDNNESQCESCVRGRKKKIWLNFFRFIWFMSWGPLEFRVVEWLWWIYYLHLFCSNLLQLLASFLCIVDLAVSQTKQDIHDQRHPKSFVENLEKSDLEPVASERCKYLFSP